MDERLFQVILAAIPVLGAIITGFIVPFKCDAGKYPRADV